MNRRAFLSAAAMMIAASVAPALFSPDARAAIHTRPSGEKVIKGYHLPRRVFEALVEWLPVGSMLVECNIEINQPLPLGLHYHNCEFVALPDFEGPAMLYAEPPRDAHERFLQENTFVIGCFFNASLCSRLHEV